MKRNICVVCSRSKGKRVCKSKDGALVCPSCCARIRSSNCEGCSYYVQAEKYSTDEGKRSEFKDFVARIDPRVDDMVDEALEAVRSGNMATGEKLLSRLLNDYPDMHSVQYAMGVAYAMKGTYDRALAHFDKAVEIFPYFAEAWFNKGCCHQKRLEVGKTIRAYQKVIRLGGPADNSVRHAKDFLRSMEKQINRETGLTLDSYLESMDDFDEAFGAMRNREWGKALAGFQKVVAVNSKNVQSYGNMGICYAALGQRQEALAAFDRALELDPDYEPALLNRTLVLSLEEGEKLPAAHTASIDYYKEYAMQEKSLLERFLGQFSR